MFEKRKRQNRCRKCFEIEKMIASHEWDSFRSVNKGPIKLFYVENEIAICYNFYETEACPSVLRIPIGVSILCESAFERRTEIEEAHITEGVIYIGSSAFYGCDNLRKVVLPRSLIATGHLVFNECPSLREIHIPYNFDFEVFGQFAYNLEQDIKFIRY